MIILRQPNSLWWLSKWSIQYQNNQKINKITDKAKLIHSKNKQIGVLKKWEPLSLKRKKNRLF